MDETLLTPEQEAEAQQITPLFFTVGRHRRQPPFDSFLEATDNGQALFDPVLIAVLRKPAHPDVHRCRCGRGSGAVFWIFRFRVGILEAVVESCLSRGVRVDFVASAYTRIGSTSDGRSLDQITRIWQNSVSMN